MGMAIMDDLNRDVWEYKGTPPEDDTEIVEKGYVEYNVHPRRHKEGSEITYMLQTVTEGKPLNAKLCGLSGSSDPLKEINICMMKVDDGVIKGIVLETEWVESK